jgi:hypothetical protein
MQRQRENSQNPQPLKTYHFFIADFVAGATSGSFAAFVTTPFVTNICFAEENGNQIKFHF